MDDLPWTLEDRAYELILEEVARLAVEEEAGRKAVRELVRNAVLNAIARVDGQEAADAHAAGAGAPHAAVGAAGIGPDHGADGEAAGAACADAPQAADGGATGAAGGDARQASADEATRPDTQQEAEDKASAVLFGVLARGFIHAGFALAPVCLCTAASLRRVEISSGDGRPSTLDLLLPSRRSSEPLWARNLRSGHSASGQPGG